MALVNGTANIICEFVANNTKSGKRLSDLNIDLIGYSRGGYTVMETAWKLKIYGCKSKGIDDEIQIRFMGLYDPVSSVEFCDYNDVWGIPVLKPTTCKCSIGPNSGLFSNPDKDYTYDRQDWPLNVDNIAVAYGNPELGMTKAVVCY